MENSINIIHTEGTKLRSRNGTVHKSKCKKHTKVNFKEFKYSQHREYSQYFIITINGVQPLKIVNHCVVQYVLVAYIFYHFLIYPL